MPNIAEVPRDVIISQTSKDTDYKFSSVYSGERDPFLGLDVVGSVVALVKQFGSEGLVGLVSIWVLWAIYSKK